MGMAGQILRILGHRMAQQPTTLWITAFAAKEL
jgi:hypothetical protein